MFSGLGRWSRGTEQYVREQISKAVSDALVNVTSRHSQYDTIDKLKKEIVDLEIQRGKKQEEFDRREREVEHKVGLERKRQEFEIQQAKRVTEVSVREENLKADRERFKGEMDFQRKHLEGEIGSLRTLVGQMLERLPSATIHTEVTRGDVRNRK